MDIAALIPAAVAIPADWHGLNWILLLFTVLHIATAAVLVGVIIIHFTRLSISARRNRLYAYEGRKILPLINAAIFTGLLMITFLMMTHGPFILSAAVIKGRSWLAACFLIILTLGAGWAADKTERHQRLFAAMALVCLLTTAFIFTASAALLQAPEQWPTYLDHPRGSIIAPEVTAILPRYLLFVAVSLCAGGLTTAFRARLDHPRNQTSIDGYYAGLTWFSNAAILCLPLALWYIASLPAHVRRLFTGNDLTATLVMAAALIFILVAVLYAGRARLTAATVTAVAALAAAVVTRDTVRQALLRDHLKPEQLEVAQQLWQPVLFLVTAALVMFCIRTVLGPGPAGNKP